MIQKFEMSVSGTGEMYKKEADPLPKAIIFPNNN